MTQDEIIEMANQAGIESDWSFDFKLRLEAFAKLVAAKALAQRTEPVADDFFKMIADRNPKPFSTPQRTWVGLTDEEFDELDKEDLSLREFVQAIDDKLKQKNGYAEEKNT